VIPRISIFILLNIGRYGSCACLSLRENCFSMSRVSPSFPRQRKAAVNCNSLFSFHRESSPYSSYLAKPSLPVRETSVFLFSSLVSLILIFVGSGFCCIRCDIPCQRINHHFAFCIYSMITKHHLSLLPPAQGQRVQALAWVSQCGGTGSSLHDE